MVLFDLYKPKAPTLHAFHHDPTTFVSISTLIQVEDILQIFGI